MVNKKILIVGTGYMGEGILKGIVSKKVVPLENIAVSNRNAEKSKYVRNTYGVQVAEDIEDAINQADIIIIAVKPQDIKVTLEDIKNNKNTHSLVVSVAAGIKIKNIEEVIGSERRIVRVMPNSIYESGYGVSAFNWNQHVKEEDIEDVKTIFSTIGETIVLKEKLINAFTGYSVSGCAYIYEFMEAMIEAGVLVGFNMEQSMEITAQNLMGAAKMIRDTKNHPAVFKGRIASPAGTTIEGLHVLNRNGFKGIVQECVRKSVDRAEELGK